MKSRGNKNNESSKRLGEFLNRPPSDDADDFDKEAREGFELLGDNEEAVQIKESLDRRMHAEVIGRNKSTRIMYRVAIAAMLVITLLSIYFIADSDPIPGRKDIAVNNVPETVIRQNETPQEPVTAASELQVTSTTKVKPRLPKVLESDKHEQPEEMAVQPKEQTEITTGVEIAAGGSGMNPQVKEQAAPAVSVPEMESSDFRVQTSETDNNARSAKRRPAAAADVVVMSAGKTEHVEPAPEASYKGGEEAIVRDLKKLLAEKKLEGKFDATVYINQNGIVEGANITNAYELSGYENILKEILMKLEGFNVIPPTPAQTRVSYNIRYRP